MGVREDGRLLFCAKCLRTLTAESLSLLGLKGTSTVIFSLAREHGKSPMKPIAIHHRKGSFSDRWIEYCQANQVPFVLVDCYSSEIIQRLRDASALLWHIAHGVATDILMARHVLNAAEVMRLPVFPNWAAQWHFDDKVAQKYLLESIGAPLVPTFAFFDLQSALAWIDSTTFPKVFKLRRGSGSRNVRLVRTPKEARRLARKAFRFGYKPSGALLDSIVARKLQKSQQEGRLWSFLRSIPAKVRHRLAHDFMMGRERGYVYFQDFVPNNDHDTRVTVIGKRAFCFRRRVRSGDFRASGSGQILFDQEAINRECIQIAFGIAQRLGTQSLAFDFVKNEDGQVQVIEVSFGYVPKLVYDCGGFWDSDLQWHAGAMRPEDAILEDMLTVLSNS